MDPNATLQTLIKAIEDKDIAAQEEAAEVLHLWLSKGGSLPELALIPPKIQRDILVHWLEDVFLKPPGY